MRIVQLHLQFALKGLNVTYVITNKDPYLTFVRKGLWLVVLVFLMVVALGVISQQTHRPFSFQATFKRSFSP